MKYKATLFVFSAITFIGTILIIANPAAAADSTPVAVEIKIDNFSFGPASLTIPAGTVVTWVNHDDIPHTVTSEDKTTFKSHPLDTDEKFTFKFDKPGSYTYFCSIHPKMTAKIIVQ